MDRAPTKISVLRRLLSCRSASSHPGWRKPPSQDKTSGSKNLRVDRISRGEASPPSQRDALSAGQCSPNYTLPIIQPLQDPANSLNGFKSIIQSWLGQLVSFQCAREREPPTTTSLHPQLGHTCCAGGSDLILMQNKFESFNEFCRPVKYQQVIHSHHSELWE